jgi:hypothetical protein
VRAGRAPALAAPHAAGENVDDLMAVVAVAMDDHAGIPASQHRQVLGFAPDGKPLLPYRLLLAVGMPLGAHVLPCDVVESGEGRLDAGHFPHRRTGVAHSA